MKKYFIFVLSLLCLAVNTVKAQAFFTVNPGEKADWAVPFNENYALPQFKQGIVFFKNKTTGSGRMNYSQLAQEMVFIDTNGDTLALSNPKEVDSVLFDTVKFYNTGDGFVQSDTVVGEARLYKTSVFYIANRQITGAYGAPTNSGGNNTSNRFTSDYASSRMVSQQIVTLSKKAVIYAGTSPKNIKTVSKKSMGNIFGKKQNAYSLYLQQHDVDFSKRGNIIELMTYMDKQP